MKLFQGLAVRGFTERSVSPCSASVIKPDSPPPTSNTDLPFLGNETWFSGSASVFGKGLVSREATLAIPAVAATPAVPKMKLRLLSDDSLLSILFLYFLNALSTPKM